jgi:phosphotransferase system enzyme I (PtsI)
MIKGIGVSPGIAVGKALVLERGGVPAYQYRIPKSRIGAECRRLSKAIQKSKRQLIQLKTALDKELGREHAYIFDAQLLMLEDEILVENTEEKIRKEAINSEWALKLVMEDMQQRFSRFADKYIQERLSDVMDVVARIQNNLSGSDGRGVNQEKGNFILVAHDLSPSDTAQLDKRKVKGIAIDGGGPTSHTSILAKSLQIPAVVSLHDITKRVHTGQLLVLDGREGVVVLNPSVAVKKKFLARKQSYEACTKKLLRNRRLPCITADGHTLRLAANIEFPWELHAALRYGAQGIGLYRTEFLFLSSFPNLPDEEEHVQVYKKLAEDTAPHAAIIRTIDLGGEKIAARLGHNEITETNPIMGLRAIRFCLREKEVFRTQLRALLRASVYGNLKILFPLISSVTELRQAREVMEEAEQDLRKKKIPFRENIEIGVMIEVPAAAAIADLLAREADFFSIGTNDLIQYCLAIDRSNENVSYLYEPVHPGVLRTLKAVVEAGHQAGIPVGVCGEMAADPWLAMLHIGLGLDDLSMNPVSIPLIKKIVRELTRQEAEELVKSVLHLSTAHEVEEILFEKIASRYPDGFV